MDRMLTMGNSWYVKAKRAQTVDDDESWIGGGVVPTLNAFDQGDTRATVVILFEDDRRTGPRFHDGAAPTLQSFMGTGGGNVPIIFSHTQGLDAQPSETVSPTLRLNGGEQAAMTDNQVRRLTPVECERLQGFPDNWTEGQSDSARYRQMGNAVAVPVVEWIIERLVAVDNE